jgi:hypothetical protein
MMGMRRNDSKRIEELVRGLVEEMDFERQVALADEILELDPDNAIAKYVKWQAMDDEESMQDIRLLVEAVNGLQPFVEEAPDDVDEGVYSFYVSMLSDLAFALYLAGNKEKAIEVAEKFMDYDKDCYIIGRLIFYAILIENGEYERASDAADADICETPIGEYCRAIALFEREGASDDASDALFQAISLDPDMLFYILGLWTFDEDDVESGEDGAFLEELMISTSVLSELWAATEERLAFLSVVAFAFGYMTGRLGDGGDIAMLEESYRNLGCIDEMSEARDSLHAMIASGRSQEEVDEEALMMFREMRNKGLFS